jgi:N-methylhydantoinase B
MGGLPGRTGFVKKNGHLIEAPKSVVVLEPHELLELGLPGGGGFGNVSERPRVLAERDVAEGYVSG